ncbi:MAG: phage tail assembly protein [Anaerolineales bacterium]|nr:phage tail assembly protein [Anaerolineales bacterium]
MLQTEFDFTLPRGYIDDYGNLHKEGTMRLATAMDEIEPLRDPRVRSNEAYLTVVLLSRVVTRLGTFRDVSPAIIERLFAADLAYLQDFYQEINGTGAMKVSIQCPNCGHHFTEEISLLGGES